MPFKHLEGLIAAPFTPMQEDGTLHPGLIPDYYRLLKQNGITGAFICGSTGEGASLTMQEKKAVAEAWAESAGKDPDFQIITLVGGPGMEECIELARHAQQVGLYGVAFTAPYYYKPADVGVLAQTCRVVAEKIPGMPFYYYHIPVLTGVSFPMIDLLRDLDGTLPNLAGIKYTHEDFMDYLSCRHFQNGKYDMLWGRDESWLAALALGAKGAVGSTYNYAAPLYHSITEAFEKGDLEDARRRQQQSIDMIGLLSKYGGIATGKAFMKLIGLDCGAFRLPVKNMTNEMFQLFATDAERVGFREYCSQNGAVKRV